MKALITHWRAFSKKERGFQALRYLKLEWEAVVAKGSDAPVLLRVQILEHEILLERDMIVIRVRPFHYTRV